MSTTLKSVFPRPPARTTTPASRAKKARPGMKAPTRDNITAATDLDLNAKACQETRVSNGTTAPWPGNLHMVPNATARCALFGCARRTAAKGTVYGERTLRETDEGVLKYIGPDLDQNDAVIWQLALAWCRASGKPIGQEVDFVFNDWCRVLERSESSGHVNDVIMKSLERLASGTLKYETKVSVDVFHLIAAAGRNKTTGKGYVQIDHRAAAWLGADTSELDLHRKVKLKSNLASWMHDHFSTSSTPYPMNLSTLRDLSGTNQDLALRMFRIRVLDAIDELQKCDPPLFTAETRVEKKDNGDYSLIVVKATNSRIVPMKRTEQAAPVAQAEPMKLVAQPAPVAEPKAQSATVLPMTHKAATKNVRLNAYGEVETRSAAEIQAASQRARVAL